MKNRSDILVIGGGVIGLACAYYLSGEGRQVQIIEQDKIGYGASHGNCGLLYFSSLLPLRSPGTIQHELKRMLLRSSPLYVKFGLDVRRLVWLLKFAAKCNANHLAHAVRAKETIQRHSKLLYEKLFDEENIKGDWQKMCVLLVYKSEAEMQKHAATNEYLKPYGLQAQSYTGDALFKLEPALREDVKGGWHHPIDSHLRPDKFVEEWKQVLIDKGVAIEEGCRLKKLICDSGRVVKAVTDKGEFSAAGYVWPRAPGPLKLRKS